MKKDPFEEWAKANVEPSDENNMTEYERSLYGKARPDMIRNTNVEIDTSKDKPSTKAVYDAITKKLFEDAQAKTQEAELPRVETESSEAVGGDPTHEMGGMGSGDAEPVSKVGRKAKDQ